ncbi:AEC family transporter [Azospirillum sp. YIM B02556]|uniref:AEC family transporter n=1 Tax=Azospirillum endophyticum TaxID=2800326 RepID=A0ABS1EXR0_9PROT|nr:AEC family transporter [Azospirillum endophyticum]MBK1835949.1 AEC family transporter [Azospirillum endophyticum]
MLEIVTALVPIFVLIVMGFALRHRGLVADEFWLPCEKLNYFCLFPALMFSQIATASFGGLSLRPMAMTLLGAVLVGGSILYAWRLFHPQPGPVFSSVLQGALRPNTYVGVAAATALYGQSGLTVTAVAIAIMIPLLNVGSIVVLAIHGKDGPVDKGRLAKTILTNPVILSVLAGALVNGSGLPVPKAMASVLTILGGASLPLGLLAVGAGLDMTAARVSRGPVMQSSVVKLALVPLATYAIGSMLGLRGVTLSAVVLFNALPCTPSTYIMARILGGDHRVAAGIISIQTALAAVSIPALLVALTWPQA